MRIEYFSRHLRPMTIVILPFLCLFLFYLPASARRKKDEEPKVTNIRWVMKSDMIVVNYDLVGSADAKYEVDIAMKNEKDAAFSVVPASVDGDVGQGSFAGPNREIRWYYRHDYPKGFEGIGYYIEIHVKTISDQSNLLYYIIGAAAVTGGVIALVVGKGQNSGGGGVTYLPMPPGRP